jgi:NADH-quinone oxidoreductase subunit A
MAQYLPIFMLLVLALIFGALSRVASRLLAPRHSTAAKSAPYECGITSSTETPERFPVTFFLIAMIFIVFDIEIVFLFPWATVYKEIGAFGFGAIIIFAACVFESFVYLIGNGALDWGPVKQVRERLATSPLRTSATTIRRVGLEGRPGLVTAAPDEHAAAAHHEGEPAAHGDQGEPTGEAA